MAASDINGAAYWIIRWSLSSGGAPAPTRWRMMTSTNGIPGSAQSAAPE
jgi:hypothetical protein